MVYQRGSSVALEPDKKDPDPWAHLQVPNPHSPRLQFYNEIVAPLYTFVYGKVPDFKEYLESPQSFRWEVVQELKDLQKVSESLQHHAWGVGHNVGRYKEFPNDPKPADVRRAEQRLNTIESFSESMNNIKKKLQQRRGNLFKSDHACYSWAGNELSFIIDHLKTVQGLCDNILKLGNAVKNTNLILNKRIQMMDVDTGKRIRKQRQKKEQINSLRRRKEKVAVKQAKKILTACCPDKVVSDFVPKPKIKLKVSELNLSSLRLTPKLHLRGVQYLLNIGAWKREQFQQFENILLHREALRKRPR